MTVSIYGLNVSFEIQFLEHLGEKNSKIFPCEALLWCFMEKMFIEVPLFQETSPALKYSWLRALVIVLTSS